MDEQLNIVETIMSAETEARDTLEVPEFGLTFDLIEPLAHAVEKARRRNIKLAGTGVDGAKSNFDSFNYELVYLVLHYKGKRVFETAKQAGDVLRAKGVRIANRIISACAEMCGEESEEATQARLDEMEKN
jgi:hypothetical protein